MSEQEVQMSPSGELNFNIPQQVWTGDGSIQTSHFASQQMILKRRHNRYYSIGGVLWHCKGKVYFIYL